MALFHSLFIHFHRQNCPQFYHFNSCAILGVCQAEVKSFKLSTANNLAYLKSSVICEHFLAESAVVYVVAIMDIEMNFDLLFFPKHFSA